MAPSCCMEVRRRRVRPPCWACAPVKVVGKPLISGSDRPAASSTHSGCGTPSDQTWPTRHYDGGCVPAAARRSCCGTHNRSHPPDRRSSTHCKFCCKPGQRPYTTHQGESSNSDRPDQPSPGGPTWTSRKRAKTDRRITAEYLKLYALEEFLLRLAHSEHRHRFVLKGRVLLAAYQLRRPTADIDFAALQTTNDVESIRQDVIAIAGTPLPEHLDDGLTFDLDNVTAQVIWWWCSRPGPLWPAGSCPRILIPLWHGLCFGDGLAAAGRALPGSIPRVQLPGPRCSRRPGLGRRC